MVLKDHAARNTYSSGLCALLLTKHGPTLALPLRHPLVGNLAVFHVAPRHNQAAPAARLLQPCGLAHAQTLVRQQTHQQRVAAAMPNPLVGRNTARNKDNGRRFVVGRPGLSATTGLSSLTSKLT